MHLYLSFTSVILLCVVEVINSAHHHHIPDQQVEASISKYPKPSGDETKQIENIKKGVNLDEENDSNGVLPPSSPQENGDDKALVNQVLSIMQMSKSNEDVITQAFRFVRLDAHLSTLLAQLNQLRESQEVMQTESIKRQTKFNVVLDEIRLLAANVAKESVRLTEIEERLESEVEMMNDRIDSALEKIIQSAVTTQLLLDLSKETIQQTDKSVGISNEILMELKNVRTELGDVGQASVQTIYNVQKLEESLLTSLEETGNKTIFALRQDQQLQYQVLPLSSLSSTIKSDSDEITLVPYANVKAGTNFQADGTISPPLTSNSLLSPVAPTGLPSGILESIFANSHDNGQTEKTEMDDKSKKSGNGTAPPRMSYGDSIAEKLSKVESLMTPPPSPCSSSPLDKRIELGRPRDCRDIQIQGHTSNGVYRIFPDMDGNGTEVYCDMITEGGGWTVIQRRKETLLLKEDFERGWDDYVSGFGILHDSHFLGLDIISQMTRGGVHLRIDMTDWAGESRFANYNYFRVANATELFKLFVTDYTGNAGDSLSYHNEMKFTTKDRDNDLEKNYNCAEKYHGAWWYKSCHQSNLNGIFIGENNGKHSSYANGINWYSWHGYYYSLKRTEMKIRPASFDL